MKLYLLRHGQAVANVHRLVTVTPDDPLTAEGERQARQAQMLLRKCSFDAYVVSHWKRARQTGELATGNNDFFVDRRLGETDAGLVSDWSRAHFEQQHPDFFAYFDPSAKFPGGESHDDLFKRVIMWMKETAAVMPENASVLAVSHMGPISCMLQYALGIPMSLFPRFKPGNASLTYLKVGKKAIPEQIQIVYYAVTPDIVCRDRENV